MKKRSSIVGGLLLALSCCAVACEPPTPGPQGDSHTNWLRSCESDVECGGELSCLCGLCSKTCSNDAACSTAEGSSCFAADREGAIAACSGAKPPFAGMCLPSCSDGDCAPGFACVAGACLPEPAPSAEVAVDTSTHFQTLAGFGATIGYAEDELSALTERAALDQAMFAGLGLDVLRVRNRYGEVTDPRLAQAQALVDAATASLGRAPLVLLSAWSPPPNLKQNAATFCASGPASCTLSLLPGGSFDYAGFAKYWRNSLDAYARVGLRPDYVGIQNNPNWAPAPGVSAEACKFLPTEGTETVTVDGAPSVVRYPGYAEALGAVMTELQAMATPPKLLAPDLVGIYGAERYFDALDTLHVDAIAHHMYGSSAATLDLSSLAALGQLQASMAVPLFQTEMQAGGFDTALLMHHTLVSEGAAMYLQTALIGPRSGPATNPTALIGLENGDFVLQDPYFAMRHYALYTDPGYTRVAATSSASSVLVSAWQAPDSSALTVVLINAGTQTEVVTLDVGAARSFSLTRTVFDGPERMEPLGTWPSGSKISLPPRGIATARFE
jgi:glucuronoarabinoxylan endo-1,4-beta-xylanase